jgi:hypothetical protein
VEDHAAGAVSHDWEAQFDAIEKQRAAADWAAAG